MSLKIGDQAPNFKAKTTVGEIDFHQWIENSWAILFSHPKSFTPVCTTELGYMAGLKKEFDKRNVKIIGLIDNMSHFETEDGKSYAIFGEGGVERTAKEFSKNFLGKIPINADIGKAADSGKPLVEVNPNHEISKIYLQIAEKIKLSFQ